jgi:3-phenylpropionate/cinnamic acid dioxygenase small subunit
MAGERRRRAMKATVSTATEHTTHESPAGSARRVRVREPLYADVVEFYYDEARLLDEDRFDEWFELLADDLRYRMPIRVTRHRADGAEFSEGTGHYYDNKASMGIRVRRLVDTAAAYAEDPPSRVRRFVTNLAVEERDDGLLRVRSYLLLLRSRFDDPEYVQLSAERDDLLRGAGDGYRLVSRRILVDQSTIGNNNIAVFL